MDAKIRKLAAGVHKAKTKVAKVQFELNLKITKLKVKSFEAQSISEDTEGSEL